MAFPTATGLVSAYLLYGSGAPTSTFASGPPIYASDYALYQDASTGLMYYWNKDTAGWALLGGSGAVTQLSDHTVSGSSVATYTISGISGAYNHLWLVTSLATTSGNKLDDIMVQMNSDTGTNYCWQLNSAQSTGSIYANANADTAVHIGRASGGASPSGDFSGGSSILANYASTTPNKAINTDAGLVYDATHIYADKVSGVWLATTAITALKFTPGAGSWAVGSRWTLYGLT